ncbi:hypothetical protein [Halorussus marinus]|uniref:hypothetical protein n=1 Tax=Halorussus marinus TaxID=2505976 RepID=UPI001091AC9B|nr:hypothetical protein [Halorussus marinus]
MVSKAFFTGSKYLVEDNDGRQDFLRYDGERFLSSLASAGRTALRAPIGDGERTSPDADDPDELKTAYLKALVGLNRRYFAAREYESEATGKYYKHDQRAERRFRIETAERFSDAAEDLRTVLAAHDALSEAAADRAERAGPDRRERLVAFRSALVGCTDGAVSDAWFPTVQAYYYSLSPRELVAEDRERRKQRIEGTESSRGVAQLLAKPHFRKLTRRDVRRIRELNRESPGTDPGVWKRLNRDYWWYLTRERSESTGDDGSMADP